MSWSPLDREGPRDYIEEAIRIFKERNGKVIVEIGCMRQGFNHPVDEEPENCPSRLDGHSTAIFGATGATFYSVDINPKAINLAREYTKDYPNTKVIQQDGLDFLTKFKYKIDLLFLDAVDVDLPHCESWHVGAYLTAVESLHKDSIILIDDVDCEMINGKLQPKQSEYGGKGRLLVPLMLKEGWKILRNGRCVILCQQ